MCCGVSSTPQPKKTRDKGLNNPLPKIVIAHQQNLQGNPFDIPKQILEQLKLNVAKKD